MYSIFSHLSPSILFMSVTDLYGSRRARAGRAMVDPDAPGTGTGWSRGCSVEEGSLKRQKYKAGSGK